jgi:hypothetical protein
MLPKVYDPDRYTVGGHYLSEKLEGVRAFWDGGMSRGKATAIVPWANCLRPLTQNPIATGLWSIHGRVIPASDKFLNTLPCMPLDGVLWAGRGNVKIVQGACSGDTPGPDWDSIEYAVISTPALDQVYRDGEIKTAWGPMRFKGIDAIKWMKRFSPFLANDFYHLASSDRRFVSFDTELAVLRDCLPFEGLVYLHRQIRLPFGVKDAAKAVAKEVEKLTKLGAAGVMLRDGDSRWEARRMASVLKHEIK